MSDWIERVCTSDAVGRSEEMLGNPIDDNCRSLGSMVCVRNWWGRGKSKTGGRETEIERERKEEEEE